MISNNFGHIQIKGIAEVTLWELTELAEHLAKANENTTGIEPHLIYGSLIGHYILNNSIDGTEFMKKVIGDVNDYLESSENEPDERCHEMFERAVEMAKIWEGKK